MPAKKDAARKPEKSKSGAKTKSVTKTNSRRSQGAPTEKREESFPVVGLGASAGGLDALRAFFTEVPPDSGMAYIVVVHLTPKQPSLMKELLQKVTPLAVAHAEDGHAIAPNHVYVVPPDKEIFVSQGRLQVADVPEKHSRLPIDAFLRSLARDQGDRAAAVILSGTGTDGTLGAKEIKANDGLVVVQSEESAAYDGMPRSAIHSGAADIILPPGEMAGKLAHYFAHLDLIRDHKPAAVVESGDWLNKIFAVLRTQVGHDFSPYKRNTLLRRISRRMGLSQIESHEAYVDFLRENPGEVDALFRELLIGVTSFFRDPDSFEALKTGILPELLRPLAEDTTFRAWVPGCSTGEEVYSLAMVLREVLGDGSKRVNVQLFGTDIDNLSIDKAREGLYPASIVADVGEARLRRFFTKEGEFYRVRKEIRDCAVFSVQNLVKDPPFSHLHLLSCRNLLIYLDGDAQKKLMPLYHYTLAPDGVMMLGSSETIGGFSHLFETLDTKWKIFRRREVPPALRYPMDFPTDAAPLDAGTGAPALDGKARPKIDFIQVAQRAILEQICPAAVLVDARGNLLYVQGRSGKYLETPSGPPTQNIMDMARTGLRIELASALRAAKTSGRPVTRRKIGVQTNGDVQWIDLHVHPQRAPQQLAGCFLVVFEDVAPAPPADTWEGAPAHLKQASVSHIVELEKELQSTRESHQTTVEELESSNEELKSTNEELQSSNEELQSTNEELESSKEELQSLNEELQTVNAELQSKVDELSDAHDDMRNLFNGTEIATVFVDSNLRIRRFTPEATAIINLIQTDIGRPLEHVVTNLAYQGMHADLAAVLEKLVPRQVEVQSTTGHWYAMRIIPYRTTDNRIDGAVITFTSIDEQKKTQQVLEDAREEMEQAWALVRATFDMNPDPLVVLERQGRMVIANAAFAELVRIAPDKIPKMDIFKIKDTILDQTDLRAKLEAAFEDGGAFQVRSPIFGDAAPPGTCLIKGQVLRPGDDRPAQVLLHIAREP